MIGRFCNPSLAIFGFLEISSSFLYMHNFLHRLCDIDHFMHKICYAIFFLISSQDIGSPNNTNAFLVIIVKYGFLPQIGLDWVTSTIIKLGWLPKKIKLSKDAELHVGPLPMNGLKQMTFFTRTNFKCHYATHNYS